MKKRDLLEVLMNNSKQFIKDFFLLDCPDCLEAYQKLGEYDFYLTIKKRDKKEGKND